METTTVSDSLLELLNRQDMRRKAAGTAKSARMKIEGRGHIGAAPQFARAGEDQRTSGGLKLVWTNTAMVKTAQRGVNRAALTMIVCRQ